MLEAFLNVAPFTDVLTAKVAFATCYVYVKSVGTLTTVHPLLPSDLLPHQHLNQSGAPVLRSRISSAITGMHRAGRADMLWRNAVGYTCIRVINMRIISIQSRSVSAF